MADLTNLILNGVTYSFRDAQGENDLNTFEATVSASIKGALDENTDLNSVVDNGTWVLTSVNYLHLPYDFYAPAQLMVSKLLYNYCTQILVDCYYGKTWIRRSSNGNWSEWSTTGGSLSLLPRNSDLNDVIYGTKHLLASNNDYKHLPGSLKLPGYMDVNKYDGTNLVIQCVTEYGSGKIYTRRRTNGTWNAWQCDTETKNNRIAKFDYNSIGEDYSTSGYYKAGNLVIDPSWASCIMPMPKHSYLACYNTSGHACVEILNGSKEYVKDAEMFTSSFDVLDNEDPITKNMAFYVMDQQYQYINIIYKRNTNPPFFATDKLVAGVFASDDFSSFSVDVSGDSILNLSQKSYVGDALTGIFPLNGEPTGSNWHTKLMMFKKGTVIDASNTGINFRVCVMGNNAYYFTSRKKRYSIKEDSIGYIQIYPNKNGWKWNIWEPDINAVDYKQFIRIISPEETENNQWAGKTWWCFGTSLSDIGPFDINGHNSHSGKYPLCVEALSGLKRINGAIGSGGYTNLQPSNRYVTANVLQTPYDCDLATLEILPNDNFRDDSILGDIGDYTTDTICGALSICLNHLTSKTMARVVVIFVNWRIKGFDGESDDYVVPVLQEDHLKYRNAVDKLKKICEIFGVPAIDANADALEWGKRRGGGDAVAGTTYRDFVHPSYLGGEIFGRYIWDKIRTIKPFEGEIIKDLWTYTTPTLVNGSASNPNDPNAISTDYISITAGKTAYCKVNKNTVENGFYLFGYAVYDASRAIIDFVDYSTELVMPTARVELQNARYIRFTIAEKRVNESINVDSFTDIPLRIADFANNDVVVGISPD